MFKQDWSRENWFNWFISLICILFLFFYFGESSDTWTGDKIYYPNGVLTYHHLPPLADPMNLLSDAEKDLIQKRLKETWDDRRVALFVIIDEPFDWENFKIFEAIPNGRTKAIIYTKDKLTQQWGFYVGHRHVWHEGTGRASRSKSETIIQPINIDLANTPSPTSICSQLSDIISQQSQLVKPIDRDYIVKYERVQNTVLIIFISVVSLIILSLWKNGKNGWAYKFYHFICLKEF